MPKKDTATAVLGMLSTAGAQTRLAAATTPPDTTEHTGPEPTATPPAPPPAPAATVSTLPPVPAPTAPQQGPAAPRTIRLRTETAHELRAAWLEAKRDDVLLQSQDFASMLVEEALAARRRRARAAASTR